MKTSIWLTAAAMLMAMTQIGCSQSQEAQALAGCQQDPQSCTDTYIQLEGGAAASGQSQVAAQGATVLPGQVPNTAVLPASVTNQQVIAKSAEIKAALASLPADAKAELVRTPASNSASSSETSSDEASSDSPIGLVDIGVARLSDSNSASSSTNAPASSDSGGSDSGAAR